MLLAEREDSLASERVLLTERFEASLSLDDEALAIAEEPVRVDVWSPEVMVLVRLCSMGRRLSVVDADAVVCALAARAKASGRRFVSFMVRGGGVVLVAWFWSCGVCGALVEPVVEGRRLEEGRGESRVLYGKAV